MITSKWVRSAATAAMTTLLAIALSGCQPSGVVHVTNKTDKTLIIYISNADPKVNNRVPTGSAPPNSDTDIHLKEEGCQPYALDAMDGSTLVARREGPTCMGDSWIINR